MEIKNTQLERLTNEQYAQYLDIAFRICGVNVPDDDPFFLNLIVEINLLIVQKGGKTDLYDMIKIRTDYQKLVSEHKEKWEKATKELHEKYGVEHGQNEVHEPKS